MGKRKRKEKSSVAASSEEIAAREVARRIQSLPKATFISKPAREETAAAFIPAKSSGVGPEDEGPNETSAEFWRQRWEEDRLQNLESRIDAKYTGGLANLSESFRKELSDHKLDLLKWAIGTVVCIIIGLAVYHFAALREFAHEVSTKVSQDLRLDIKAATDLAEEANGKAEESLRKTEEVKTWIGKVESKPQGEEGAKQKNPK